MVFEVASENMGWPGGNFRMFAVEEIVLFLPAQLGADEQV